MTAAVAVATPTRAGEVHVAVAANFTEPATEIGALFEAATGHTAVFSFASTGQLYAQIAQGAPFEVFLAADRARAQKAVEDGLAVAESRFTYATGRIVLYSADPALVTGEETLARADFTRIAIANPETAPYGAAAIEVMRALGVYNKLEARIVRGNNIAQAYQFVATGNAELGFVALAQVADHKEGSRWIVPESLYAPIAQDAVLLKNGKGNGAAVAFIDFLQSDEARAVIEAFGYGPGSPIVIPDARRARKPKVSGLRALRSGTQDSLLRAGRPGSRTARFSIQIRSRPSPGHGFGKNRLPG